MKRCSRCGEEKPLSEFHNNKVEKDGKSFRCKDCASVEHKKYADGTRNSCYVKRYGITLEDYDAMLVAQNGVCAVCGEVNKNGRALSVDHNHNTGKVRGLLCNDCNVALAFLEDDPITKAFKIYKYLMEFAHAQSI